MTVLSSTRPKSGSSPTACLVAALVALLAFHRGALAAASPPFKGGLAFGRHEVGFETIVAEDRSRAFPAATGLTRPRPVVIAVWYPATKGTGRMMQLGDYLLAEGTALSSAGLLDSSAKRREEFFAEAGRRGADRGELDRLLALRSVARRGAGRLKRSFPVLLWAHTDTLAKAIPCEYLASHGYVVVSTSVVGTFERDLDVGLSGAETSARDLEFALAEVAARGLAIPSRTAILGMSFGGLSEICHALRHPELRAIVSLDGGGGSASGAATVQQSAFFDPARLTAPLLHLYQPEGADTAFFDALRYCRRTLVRFSGLRHADFSGSGLLEERAPRYFGPPTADRGAPRTAVWKTVLDFLQASFSDSRAASTAVPEIPAAMGETRVIEPLPPPLRLEELRALVARGGIPALEEAYRKRQERDATPVSEDTCRKLGSWLLETRSREEAHRVFEMQLAMYPRSARAHYSLGAAELGLGDKTSATLHLIRALELLPEDSTVDAPTRRRIEKAAREALQ
ncbi:MAG: hypothetical protein M3S32_07605 [Acidobacteriota bacterium]|nr:hypothetical protein [Acidobacteriota bacterium]